MAKVPIQYFPDIMEAIVTSIQTDSLPRFSYGYWLEEQNKLSVKSLNWQNSITYPFIFMPVDYDEDFGAEPIYYSSNDFILYIVGKSKINYKSEERFENVLKAILYPIYQNLMQAMIDSLSFDKEGKRFIAHEKKDLYYHEAAINENKLNQPIEVIRLTFSDLKINYISKCES